MPCGDGIAVSPHPLMGRSLMVSPRLRFFPLVTRQAVGAAKRSPGSSCANPVSIRGSAAPRPRLVEICSSPLTRRCDRICPRGARGTGGNVPGCAIARVRRGPRKCPILPKCARMCLPAPRHPLMRNEPNSVPPPVATLEESPVLYSPVHLDPGARHRGPGRSLDAMKECSRCPA